MRRFFGFLVLMGLLACSVHAQPTVIKTDPVIEHYLSQVSADSIEAAIRKLASFGTRHTLSNTTSDTEGIGAARRWMVQTMQRYAEAGGGHMQAFLDAYDYPADGRRINRDIVLKNVVATLPGIDPEDDRIFLVSGHYDSRASSTMDSTSYAPGASDDASGTAAAMEMARVLASARFPATLMFVGMTGEEQGLLGAHRMAAKADSLGWNIAGMITMDIIGNSLGDNGTKDNRSVRLFSEGVSAAETEFEARLRPSIGSENDGRARQFARYIEEVGERYNPMLNIKMIYRRDRFLRGGDHTAFSQRGYAAVRMTEPNEAFTRQHQDVRNEDGIAYGDVPDMVDFEYVASVTRSVMAAVVNAAMAPPPPKSAGILVRGLTTNTDLKWIWPDAGQDRIAGFYILIRETTSPVWQRKIFIGPKTEHTLLGVSKDDYFFGIQSVDVHGHESLIVYPYPTRN